jgi:hypothetical protein
VSFLLGNECTAQWPPLTPQFVIFMIHLVFLPCAQLQSLFRKRSCVFVLSRGSRFQRAVPPVPRANVCMCRHTHFTYTES